MTHPVAARFVGATVLVAVVVAGAVAVNPMTSNKSWADTPSILAAEGGSFSEPVINALQGDAAAVTAIQPLVPQFFDANIDLSRDDFAATTALTGTPVDYIVSELPLSDSQKAIAGQNGRTFAYVPFAASAVAIGAIVECNAAHTITPTTFCGAVCPSSTTSFCGPLEVTVAQLAKLLTFGSIGTWNSPELTQLNPSLSGVLGSGSQVLPKNAVQPAATYAALASLFQSDQTAEPIWSQFLQNNQSSGVTASDRWPSGLGESGGDSTLAQDLVPLLQVNNPPIPNPDPTQWGVGKIAALPESWMGAPRNIPTLAIQNAASTFVLPTTNSMTAAVNDATMDPTSNLVRFNASASDAAAYPIPVMSYLVVPTSGLDPVKAKALAAFIRFVLSDAGQADVKKAGAVPPRADMVNAGLHVADLVAAQGTTTTTTSTTVPPTTSTSSSTSTQPSTSGSSGSDSGTGGAGGSGSGATGGDNGSSLAMTGGVPWSLATLGGLLLIVGSAARRTMRRRVVTGPQSS